MTILDRARSLFTRSKAEGDTISGPIARVTTPEAGWLPMSWPLNFWQTGYNVLQAGDNSIVEACVLAYVRAIAQLPGYHRTTLANGGIENITTSALSRLLRFPNDYQTRSDFLTHVVRSLLYDGNSYALAVRNARQEVVALHWLNPRQCLVQVEQESGEVFYAIGDNPLLGATSMLVPARNILHVKLATPRHPLIGETWLSSLGLELMNRSAMGLSMSAFFQNMSRPSGVLSTDKILTKAQVDQLRDAWHEQSAGMNSGGVPVLTAGLKFQPMGMSNEDSQIIEALKLNDKTIAGVFGVPGILVGLQDTAGTFSSTEALMSYWLSNGLGFLLDHIETAIDQFFALPPDQYVEFDTDALLRTDFKTRIDGLARGVQTAIFSPNEARRREGLPAVKNGDEPRVQQQQVGLSWGGFNFQPPAPQAPAAPAPSGEDPDKTEPDA